jgi:hypothetical protein
VTHTQESFFIGTQQNKTTAANDVKSKKKILQTCRKGNVVAIVPSIDPTIDKKVEAMIIKYFSDTVVTVITFTDKNLIYSFILNLTTELPVSYPAFYRINTSSVQNNYMDVIKDRPDTIANVIKDYKALKATKK